MIDDLYVLVAGNPFPDFFKEGVIDPFFSWIIVAGFLIKFLDETFEVVTAGACRLN